MKKQEMIRYLVYAVLTVAVALTVASFRGLFSPPEEGEERTAKEIITILSDAFIVPGVLFAGVGGLSFALHKNAFDSISYAMRSAFRNVAGAFLTGQSTKYISYYDYKTQKDEKRGEWKPASLVVGGISFLIGMIFTVIFLFMDK